jgi:hypothetical protein
MWLLHWNDNMPTVLFAAAFLTALQILAQVSYEAEMKPLFDGFSKSCAAKNLRCFTPDDLNYRIEKFEPSMTPQQDQSFKIDGRL